MPQSTCPDPALLQACVDGTLFSRDVHAVEQHVEQCARCAAIVAALREQRDAVPTPIWSRPRVIGATVAMIALAAIGTWGPWRDSSDSLPRDAETATAPEAPAAPTLPSPAPVPDPASIPAPEPKVVTPPPAKRPVPVTAERSPRPPMEKGSTSVASPPAEASPADGVLLRGTRRSNRRVIWRARDLVIEHSTDGGMTWTTEYTADRPIRAGALVSADVAWLVGDSGLVLRRTQNGWFGTTLPAEGNIRSVRASSPSKASITFDDGRIFTTENGGATWSSQ